MNSLIKFIDEGKSLFESIHYAKRIFNEVDEASIKELSKRFENVEEALMIYNEYSPLQTCGKCPPCWIGTKRLLETMQFILEGEDHKQTMDDLMLLVKEIRNKKCPTMFYKREAVIRINETCIGCTKCSRICPASCIEGKVKVKHVIQESSCIRCGACIEVCPVKAIEAII